MSIVIKITVAAYLTVSFAHLSDVAHFLWTWTDFLCLFISWDEDNLYFWESLDPESLKHNCIFTFLLFFFFVWNWRLEKLTIPFLLHLTHPEHFFLKCQLDLRIQRSLKFYYILFIYICFLGGKHVWQLTVSHYC